MYAIQKFCSWRTTMVGANETNSLLGELGWGLAMLRPRNIIMSLCEWLGKKAGY